MDSLISALFLPLQFYIPRFFGFFTVLFVVPSCFRKDTGLRKWYKRMLDSLIKWASETLEREAAVKRGRRSSHEELIKKEHSITKVGSFKDLAEAEEKFKLDDITYIIKSGIEAVIDDDVTKRFRAEELASWNLLTRTNYYPYFVGLRLSVMWFFGIIFRYLILFPVRACVLMTGMTWMLMVMVPLSVMPDSKWKRKVVHFANVVAFRMCVRAFTGIVKYHDREKYLPKSGSICVANHTTILDVCLLMQEQPYSILGQVHGGFVGWFERTLSKCANHIWFERSEVRHRKYVVQRIQQHLSNPDNFPILMFPEGTCINNTCVMMFKKGTFEIPTTFSPVAIKYNPMFGDAFWNSSKHSWMQYLGVVMTSWAIVANVWYLPPMKRREDEDAFHFANRVRNAIAEKAGLEDIGWDGQLKRSLPKESQKQKIQEDFAKILLRGYEFPSMDLKPVDDDEGDHSQEDEEVKPKFTAAGEEIEIMESTPTPNVRTEQVETLRQRKQHEQEKLGDISQNGIIPDLIRKNFETNQKIETADVRKI